MFCNMKHVVSFMCELCPEHKKLIDDLEKRIAELEKRLDWYENPNTPPSRMKRIYVIEEKVKNRPGQKEGHEGTTRSVPKPDEIKEVKLGKCGHCNSSLSDKDSIGIERRIIEEIPKPQPVRVTEYRIHKYRCVICRKVSKASSNEIPSQGRFGNNVISYVSMMKYSERLPLRKIKEALQNRFNLKISAASIFDFTRRASNRIKNEYGNITGRIRKSEVANIDETSIRVDGSLYWIWMFVAKDTLAVIRNSRSRAVLEEVLGKDYKGIIVSDGWKSYSSFAYIQQRCWAHLLRESDFLERNLGAEASVLARDLHELYDELKSKLKENPPPDERTRLKEYAIQKMEIIVNKVTNNKLGRFVRKIRKAGDSWFTFVINPKVPSTNNIAERELRECVVQRKIIGTLRNEKGTEIFERMMSVTATWKRQGLNPYEMMANCLQS